MGIISTLSLSLVITTLAIIEFRNLKYSAYAYCLQAILMCSIFFIFAGENPNLYYWLTTAIITKVIIIPTLLLRYIKKTVLQEIPPPIGYILSTLIACIIMIVFYNITHTNVNFIAPDGGLKLRNLQL